MQQEELTQKIIGCAMQVHRTLGAGFLESVYQSALLLELRLAGLTVEQAFRVPVHYRGEVVGDFIADLLVEDSIILELKAVTEIHPAHESQVVTYLQATGLDIGLLLNFGATKLEIKRKHRTYKPSPVPPENPVILSKEAKQFAFTILELLVSMAVMSVLLVLLLGMVDGATKLWRENENRVDAYREARAALGIMSRDLRNALTGGTNTNHFALNTRGVMTLLPSEAIQDTNMGANLFFLSALPLNAQEPANKSDVCRVGYFLAFGKSSSATNSPINTMNLYRFFGSSDETFSTLQAVAGGFPFTNRPSITSDRKTELLARNVTRFSARAYSLSTNNMLTNFTASANTPLPDVIEISVSAVNQEAARKLGNSLSDWTATNSPAYTSIVRPVEQTFTTRINLNRPR